MRNYMVCTMALCALLLAALPNPLMAQISLWKLGGSGLQWARSDTSRVMVEIDAQNNALRPRFFQPGENMYLSVAGWSELRSPRELGFIDGHQPRLWYTNGTNVNQTSYYDSPLYVDGDRSTYNTARGAYWTIDIGVPVPASQFAFYTPTQGTRSDGVPLNQDPVPAYEVSVSEESDPVLLESGYRRLETLIANVPQNFESDVEIDFPRQYVRFVRYNRNQSVLDQQNTTDSNTLRGTIAEFVLRGEGVAKRSLYRSQILHLGREVNFGRLFWAGRTLRMVDGVPTEVDSAAAWIEVEVRTGRDEDPNIYHEYTDSGKEFVVTRERYENELRLSETEGILQIDRQPGIRASVQYDSENWSFWSSPIINSGSRIDLRNGAYVQLQISLQSRSFTDWVEVDSLWIEVSPPLADRVVGEVAKLSDLRPARGFTQVELGREEEFAYDIAAEFIRSSGGFDGVRVRTGSRPSFMRLEMGNPPVSVEALSVVEEVDGLSVQLPRRVNRSNNEAIRLIFAAPVFLQATTFEGEVFDSSSGNLPQPIEPGDAGPELSTNDLRVLGRAQDDAEFARQVRLSASAFSPNGDGINDAVEMAYELFMLPAPIPVEWVVYDLQGVVRARLSLGLQEAGAQVARWDGRSEGGQLLPPGIYLAGLELRSELRTARYVRPIGLAY
jgi:hypothetical protein